ncbi:uncharacterized protein LOC129623048 isoform X2 [Bubalus kerabau]|uniref:uncharacterized protein LOC129623048 isoform X2 n=1 Tax=Bubalus carabanensis TaxID=3119969 RepID=UPI00244EC9B2|nr:uncharacterized protein LOC129623048 isoform X2 [Bubalus carabanensis]
MRGDATAEFLTPQNHKVMIIINDNGHSVLGLRQAFIAMNFPLRAASLYPINFGPRLGKKFYRSSSDNGTACEFISNLPRAQAGVPRGQQKHPICYKTSFNMASLSG